MKSGFDLPINRFKTFAEFWSKFLQVDFHINNPERWSFREKKADWLINHSNIQSGGAVLDLGCGDGLLDIILSRRGYEVTAVDKTDSVIQNAVIEDDTKKVRFFSADLRTLAFPAEHYDLAFMIETLGLMSAEEDLNILQSIHTWLKPGASVLIDIPFDISEQNDWEKVFPNGVVKCKSTFDKKEQFQRIDFIFQDMNGEVTGLYDPYDKSKFDGPGIARYIYSKAEMFAMLKTAGFSVAEIPHYYEKGYYGFKGTKN